MNELVCRVNVGKAVSFPARLTLWDPIVGEVYSKYKIN